MLAVLSELVEPLPQRTVGHAELFRDVFCGSPLDEHGAERFVAPVMRIGWLSEERAAGGVVHDPFSRKVSISFAEEPGRIVNRFGQRRRGESASNRLKTEFSATGVLRPRPRHDAIRRAKLIDTFHEKTVKNCRKALHNVNRFPPCGNRRLTLKDNVTWQCGW